MIKNRLVSGIALLAITANFSIAGGYIAPAVMEPVEVEKPELVVEEEVKYDGFYMGMAASNTSVNEEVTANGYALTFIAGYYFNKYFGLEARYSRTLGDIDIDHGAEIVSQSDILENMGIYFKPMYNLTTGFSFYGLAGYGLANYEKGEKWYVQESLQWGLGAKYELANGLGLFIDYLDMYQGDDFDGLIINDITYGSVTVGTTYTF